MRAHFDYEQGIFCNSKNYHLVLEVIEGLGALGMVSNFSDGVKENLVLIIDPLIEDLEGLIPMIRLGDLMGHKARPYVLEVSILDVIDEPLLCPEELRDADTLRPCPHPPHEGLVLVLVLQHVVLGHGLLKHTLLQLEVVAVLDEGSI